MDNFSQLTGLALGWIAYGLLHSTLAALPLKAWAARRWPRFAHYRLAYNLVATITVLPLVWATYAIDGGWLWRWTGATAWLANGLALLAIAGVVAASRAYDMADFLGLHGTSGQAESLVISGFHRHVRHPWYCFSLLLIWTRDMNPALLVSATAISLYFVIGSKLEERKLITLYGDAYRRYMARVPGLLPWPGKSLTPEEAREIVAR